MALRKNPIGLLDAATSTFGKLWHELTLGEVQVVMTDLSGLATEEFDGDPYLATRELRSRIGGASALKGYAQVLLAGARRRARNPAGSPALSKEAAGYKDVAHACWACKHFQPAPTGGKVGTCALVAGGIHYAGWCTKFRWATPAEYAARPVKSPVP